MKRAFKLIRKIFITLFLLIVISITATAIYFYHYREQIIQQFITEVNKKLPYPIQIKTIQLNTLAAFPQVTLVLHEVTIQHPIKAAAKLLTAHKVCCSFDVWALLRGQYVLDQVYLEQGAVYLLANTPYQFKPREATQEQQLPAKSWALDLNKLKLKDIALVYSNQPKQQHYAIQAEQLQASLRATPQTLQADLQGRAAVQSIQLKDIVCTKAIPITLRASLSYDPQSQIFTLNDGQLKQGIATLAVQGRWRSQGKGFIDLVAKGHQIAVQSVLSYLPEQYHPYIASYQLQGSLSFGLQLNKQPTRHSATAIHADFALHGGSLAIKQIFKPINLGHVTGKLHIPNIDNLTTASMQVEEHTSTLEGSNLVGRFSLEDFHELHLTYFAKADLALASLMQFFPSQSITNVAGQLIGNWEFATSLRQLISHDSLDQAFKIAGTLQTQGVQFKLQQMLCQLQDQTNSLVWHGNALVIKNLAGRAGAGNFVLNGRLKNLLPFLLGGHQKLYLDGKLYADYLAIDELSPSQEAPTSQPTNKPIIAPYWVANLVCDIQTLHCKRFQGKRLQGKIKVKDQRLIAENLQLGLSSGKALLNSLIDASTDSLHIHTLAKLQGVRIDSLFHTFENFHQSFLEDKHLGGKVFADLDLTMQADRQWHMNWDVFRADMAIQLNDGVLRNFEPIQQLAKYVAEEDLANLRFAALKNNIQVKDRTVYIPPMEVHSNVTRIQVSGTHTFGGKVGYSFVIPLANFKQKSNLDGLEEEVEADALAGLNIYLKLQGDANNYKITYDAEAFKAGLQEKLKEQGQALKAIVKGKYLSKKVIKELAPDDYFEFD